MRQGDFNLKNGKYIIGFTLPETQFSYFRVGIGPVFADYATYYTKNENYNTVFVRIKEEDIYKKGCWESKDLKLTINSNLFFALDSINGTLQIFENNKKLRHIDLGDEFIGQDLYFTVGFE